MLLNKEAKLAKRLGHIFTDEGLLKDALTLASSSHKSAYERLEFLGDRVLGLAVSDMLYRTFPDEDEGKMAHRHTALVRLETVARAATDMGIDAALTIPKSEQSNMNQNPQSFLCDVCEAVLGALYLDGGYDKAFTAVEKFWAPLMHEDLKPPVDAKSALQEWAQGKRLCLPAYTVLEQSGPDHCPDFVVEVVLENGKKAKGNGHSKRTAEQDAAQNMLLKLKVAL